MPSLNKISSGLLLHEDFKESSLLWTPSPNNYEDIRFNDNGLQILHSNIYKTITIEEPDTNYTMICKINHKPIDKLDIGGVIIMSNDLSYIECQSYIATKPSHITNSNQMEEDIHEFIKSSLESYVEYTVTDDNGTYPELPPGVTPPDDNEDYPSDYIDIMYPYVKVTKVASRYLFMASNDGLSWIEVGNTEMPDAHRIGFFLYSKESDIEDSSFFVEYAYIYNNNYIIIDNIKEHQSLELVSPDGDIICDTNSFNVDMRRNKVFIDTTLINTPMINTKINIIQDTNKIHTHETKELIGGDVYVYSHDIKVCIDNIELNQEEIFDLGVFYNNDQTIRVDIYNQELYELRNLKITVNAYSIYYNGNETIGISLYDENEVKYKFTDEIVIDKIKPSEGKSFLIKLTDKVIQDFYKKSGIYKFKINIE